MAVKCCDGVSFEEFRAIETLIECVGGAKLTFLFKTKSLMIRIVNTEDGEKTEQPCIYMLPFTILREKF